MSPVLKILLVPLFLIFILTLYSCKQNHSSPDSIEKWKKEIVETENAFSYLAGKEGITKAFLTYAADDAVLMRNNKLTIGIDSIHTRLSRSPSTGILTWAPDFVDVAKSGDLGYTYGKYIFTVTDSAGVANSSEGIFHTVWKRQQDGNWKFVWD